MLQKSKKRTRRRVLKSRWEMRATGQILLTCWSLFLHDFTGATICDVVERPRIDEKEKTARWMMHTLNWGVLSTISSRLKGDDGSEGGGANSPVPFGNVYSFVDGPCSNSTGIPYFYSSALDQSMKDVAVNPHVSLTITEASLPSLHGIRKKSTVPYCDAAPAGRGDPMNPPCARLVVTGRFVELSRDGNDADEWEFATDALFQRHPAMEKWPQSHKWFVGKIVIEDLWLIDIFGGASILDLEKYMAVNLETSRRGTLARKSMAREYYKLFSW